MLTFCGYTGYPFLAAAVALNRACLSMARRRGPGDYENIRSSLLQKSAMTIKEGSFRSFGRQRPESLL